MASAGKSIKNTHPLPSTGAPETGVRLFPLGDAAIVVEFGQVINSDTHRAIGGLSAYSSAVMFGTVQVPPNGQPIVLMADRQTTGGYPRSAQVITADLGLLAQASPGQLVRFQEVPLAEAQALYLAQERQLRAHAAAGHQPPRAPHEPPAGHAEGD